jgi:hypothetical protein
MYSLILIDQYSNNRAYIGGAQCINGGHKSHHQVIEFSHTNIDQHFSPAQSQEL